MKLWVTERLVRQYHFDIFGLSISQFLSLSLSLSLYIYIYIQNYKHEWVQVSLRTPLPMPWAIYVHWRKQQSGNVHVCKYKISKLIQKIQISSWTYLFQNIFILSMDLQKNIIYIYIYIYIYIWKPDLTDKMKRIFFQAAVVSILLYRCTSWTLTKRLEKKLDGNYTRMLRAILNKSWRQYPTRHNYTAACLPSRKLSKSDEPDMQDTAGEARTNS